MKAEIKLLLVGCGKMGGAILQRVAEQATVYVVDPAVPPPYLHLLANVTWLVSPDKIDLAFMPDIIILAVKPQQMGKVLPSYVRFKSSVFLSIASGMPIAPMESFLKSDAYSIVRAMPNLPASIGQGISVAVANKNVSPAQRMLCDKVLKAVGETAWINDEKLMDAVTALSGNGPGYIFAFCEAMTKAGIALGLSPDMAAKLARQTMIGSGALLAQSPESAEALRIAVTSPGGTTEAALTHLIVQDGLPTLMLKAMKASLERAKELARLA